jgi:hypothetical protein
LDKTRTFSISATAALLLLAGAPAHAQTFSELMEDIGIQKRKQEKMDFSERAPLVLPPSLDAAALPPPEDAAAVASVNPNWPKDPDTQAELDELEKEKIPQRERRKYQENQAKQIYKFQAQERERERVETKPHAYETTFERGPMTPDQLKEVQKNKAAAAANAQPVVTAEPERRRLTDPPSGYRVPSAQQPYGPGEKDRESKNWLNRMNPFESSASK